MSLGSNIILVPGGGSGEVTTHEAATDPHTGYQKESEKGSDSGYPGMDASGLVDATKGIQFPATQVASADGNALDDYEEGTWTPAIADTTLDGSGEGQTYTNQVGRYTKIGNRVYLNGRLNISSLGCLSTCEQAFIVGFPFTSKNTANAWSSLHIGRAAGLSITAGQVVTGLIKHNVAYSELRLWDGTGGTSDLLLSAVTADADFSFSAQYEV